MKESMKYVGSIVIACIILGLAFAILGFITDSCNLRTFIVEWGGMTLVFMVVLMLTGGFFIGALCGPTSEGITGILMLIIGICALVVLINWYPRY